MNLWLQISQQLTINSTELKTSLNIDDTLLKKLDPTKSKVFVEYKATVGGIVVNTDAVSFELINPLLHIETRQTDRQTINATSQSQPTYCINIKKYGYKLMS